MLHGRQPEEIRFAYLLLQSKEAVNIEIIKDYIFRKTGEKVREISMNSKVIFQKLEEILEGIRRGMDIYGQGKARQDSRMIILD